MSATAWKTRFEDWPPPYARARCTSSFTENSDHVLVERLGRPVLIDIEGLMFFDTEWEHAFLRIRFGDHYQWLTRGGLDEQRVAFYTLAMRLSLVAGPLRLLDGDFPGRDAMIGIAEHNLQQVLALLPESDG